MNIEFLTTREDKPLVTAEDIVLGKDGSFVCKETIVLPIGTSVIWRKVTDREMAKAFNVKVTEDSIGMSQGGLKKLPYTFREDARSYFRHVYDIFSAEAALLIHLSTDGEYVLLCPARTNITAGSVTNFDTGIKKFCPHCRVTALIDNQRMCYLCGNTNWVPTNFFGTMHSHGTGGAFWSSADDANELTLTGYHITFGRVTTEPYDTAESFVTAQPENLGPDGRGTRWEYAKGGTLDRPFSAFESPTSKNYNKHWPVWMQTLSGTISQKNLDGFYSVSVGNVRELSRATLDVANRYKQVIIESKNIPETEIVIAEASNITVMSTSSSVHGNVHSSVHSGVHSRVPYGGGYSGFTSHWGAPEKK